VIDGCQTDLDQTRFLDYPALQRYCHLVAGVVGEVAANIFGRTQTPARCSTRTSWAWRCS
jgi:phytoene synthase